MRINKNDYCMLCNNGPVRHMVDNHFIQYQSCWTHVQQITQCDISLGQSDLLVPIITIPIVAPSNANRTACTWVVIMLQYISLMWYWLWYSLILQIEEDIKESHANLSSLKSICEYLLSLRKRIQETATEFKDRRGKWDCYFDCNSSFRWMNDVITYLAGTQVMYLSMYMRYIVNRRLHDVQFVIA